MIEEETEKMMGKERGRQTEGRKEGGKGGEGNILQSEKRRGRERAGGKERLRVR